MTDRLETWRQIPGYPGYEVSDQGRVRSVDRVVLTTKGQRVYRGKLLKPGTMNRFGHVSVVVGRKAGSKCVHDLVLRAFKGPPPKGHEGLHRDGDGANNRLSNLRWGTRSENNRDITVLGRRKLTVEQAEAARERYRNGEFGTVLAKEYGVCQSNMYYILRGEYY